MKKLRLLITEECNRSCEGCCNNDWEIRALPTLDFNNIHICNDFDEIIITGGEPLLDPIRTAKVVNLIQKYSKNNTKFYLYTAFVDLGRLSFISRFFDGITLTLHEQKDVENLKMVNEFVDLIDPGNNKSLRLSIFQGINIDYELSDQWIIKDNMEWIKDCPLPDDEVFMRIDENEV